MGRHSEPIATAYNTLQSLDTIDQMYSVVRDANGGPHRALLRGACIELLFQGCRDLCDRGAATIQRRLSLDALEDLSSNLAWHVSLLQVALTIAHSSEASSLHTRSGRPHICKESLSRYVTAFDLFSHHLHRLLSQHAPELRNAIANGRSNLSVSMVMHTYKRAVHYFRCVTSRVTCDTSHSTDAIARLALKAATELAIHGRDTYFLQFRVLHQVPELIGREAISVMSAVMVALRQPIKSHRAVNRTIEQMSDIGYLMNFIVQCIEPIAAWMYPADYFRIRRNLGQTSGSHSDTLSHKLFREDILSLGNTIVDLSSAKRNRYLTDAKVAALQESVMRLISITILWKDLHFQFPRQVLGRGRVKSLIGAPEALDSAGNLLNSFLRKMRENMEIGGDASSGVGLEISAGIDACDTFLLEQLGDVVKQMFTDVQDRSGPFKGKQHEKHDATNTQKG